MRLYGSTIQAYIWSYKATINNLYSLYCVNEWHENGKMTKANNSNWSANITYDAFALIQIVFRIFLLLLFFLWFDLHSIFLPCHGMKCVLQVCLTLSRVCFFFSIHFHSLQCDPFSLHKNHQLQMTRFISNISFVCYSVQQ